MPSCARTIGREHELGRLRVRLADALVARGHLVLLAGEAGIGKTQLAEAAADEAERTGALVLRGRCREGADAPAGWMWAQALRGYVATRQPGALAAELAEDAAAVAEIVPSIRDRIPCTRPAAIDSAAARFRLSDAVARFVRGAARERPLVFVFEDVHAADPLSLWLLQFIAPELADARILAIATYRDVDVRRDAQLAAAVAELARHAELVPLGGLDRAGVAALMRASTPASEALIAAVHRASGGNPLFVIEITAALGAGDASAALPLPDQLRETIRQRVGVLPQPVRDLLALGAVAGDAFDVALLQHVSRHPVADVIVLLEDAVVAGILEPEAVGRFTFRHALVRETIRSDLATAERARLHGALADALEALHGGAPDLDVRAVAEHRLAAARAGGDAARAVPWARRAGDQAVATMAYDEAVRQYAAGLAALDLASGGTSSPAEDTGRCELLLARAAARHKAGDAPAARTDFEHAATLARALGRDDLLLCAAIGCCALGPSDVGIVDEARMRLLEEAIARGRGSDALRARALACLARERSWSEAGDGWRTPADDAVALARRSGDRIALAHVLRSAHDALGGPDDVGERVRIADELVELATAVGDRELALQGHDVRHHDFLELGRGREADADLERYVRLASELRQPRYIWYADILRATRALFEGRFDEAEARARGALELGRSVQPSDAEQLAGAIFFRLRTEQGRLDELVDVLVALSERFPNMRAWHGVLAFVYTELGRPSDARRELERLALEDFAAVPRNGTWLGTLCHLAKACSALHDTTRAAILYEMLTPFGGLNIVLGAGLALGSGARHLGRLATTLAHWDDARRHFDAAVEMNTRLGARPALARTQAEYAAMLTARGAPTDRARVDVLLIAAHATAVELGMRGLAAQIDAAAASAPRTDAPLPAVDGVFRREGDFWTVGVGGHVVRVRAMKGLEYVADLLRQPNVDRHVADLATGPVSAGRLGDAGALLDVRAKADYRARVAELRHELDEATESHDDGRAAHARLELEAVSEELSRAVGLGGRDRRAAADVERARVNVTRRIAAAIRRIAACDATLGEHLAASIRTGTFCRYRPDPLRPVRWVVA